MVVIKWGTGVSAKRSPCLNVAYYSWWGPMPECLTEKGYHAKILDTNSGGEPRLNVGN